MTSFGYIITSANGLYLANTHHKLRKTTSNSQSLNAFRPALNLKWSYNNRILFKQLPCECYYIMNVMHMSM